MKNNPLVLFLGELLSRFATKSPRFFRVFKLISGVTYAITGLPEVIKWAGIKLPPTLCTFENHVVSVAAAAVFFMSMLTVDKNSIPPDDSEIKNKLPFSYKQ